MERDPKMRICYDRIVPIKKGTTEDTLHTIYKEAIIRDSELDTFKETSHKINPEEIRAIKLALINLKIWPAGSTLRCRFLDGSSIQKSKVAHFAKIWEQYANIHFDFVTTNDEHIRISFKQDGSWSAVGTDALNTECFPKDQPTMNFGWLEDDTDDNEYERVVVHEFGHALGCIHEHQQPNEHLEWNKEVVYAQFSGPPNFWSKKEIDDNILDNYSPEGINATIFDKESIMLYQFPAKLFLNHVGTPINIHLSEKDMMFISEIYPKN